MTNLNPFTNESQTVVIGGLTVENRLDRVSVFGEVDLTKDKLGLNHARQLLAVLTSTVAALEAEKGLPDELPPPAVSNVQRDPFA